MLHAEQIVKGLTAENHFWGSGCLGVRTPKKNTYWFALKDGNLEFLYAYSSVTGLEYRDEKTYVRAERYLCHLAGLDDAARSGDWHS